MTADHWGFVFTAYGLVALVLTAYWRRLVRIEREVTRAHGSRGGARAHRRVGRDAR
jgi:hypothetical protein